ncbi:GTPase-associated protein 1-related protein [Streptomyces sp. RKAG293]|uniref:GTPase-associated protein 1-related protein n=1 Tax=Streptomyces sp. RKAG293 TaxID=2893403 RepID=UPI002033765C|nr:GTPase-associated protein 1-related protein [Streptomyces sp. RKAG293]MCM2422613.1 hypothetical protein [Streptomyces sp. RKAG293]
MAFQQLYYTSCEHGLSGFSGYQFNAVSEHATEDVRRRVEALSLYEPPKALAYSETPEELARCPVNLCFVPGDEVSVATCVRYVGQDPSHRFGNYFAHALSSPAFEADLGSLLPIELWDAPFWSSLPTTDSRLPELSAPPPSGRLTPGSVRCFLAGHSCRTLLPLLLAAVMAAFSEQRSVLVVDATTEDIAHWFAAVSYLMPPRLARRLAFATYLSRPDRSRLHLMGTVPGARSGIAPENRSEYYVFDFTAGLHPDLAIPPLARLLAGIDVDEARSFWSWTEEYVDGTEREPVHWYPPAVAAAAASSAELGAEDIAAVVHWLAGADHLSGPIRAAVALDVYRRGGLTVAQLELLGAVCRRAGDQALLEQVQSDLLEIRLCRYLERSPEAERPTPYTNPSLRELARSRWGELLVSARPAEAVRLLHWALLSDLCPDNALVARASEQALLGLLSTAVTDATIKQLAGELGDLARQWSAFRRGVVGALDRQSLDRPHQFPALFDELPEGLLQEDDFQDLPTLREQFLIAGAKGSGANRMRLLIRLLGLRPAGVLEQKTLEQLWPRQRWTRAEALALALELPSHIRPGKLVNCWFSAVLRAESHDDDDLRTALALCRAMAPRSKADWLDQAGRRAVEAVIACDDRLEGAANASELLPVLKELTATAAPLVRSLVEARLPRALLSRPAEVQDIRRLLTSQHHTVSRSYLELAVDLLRAPEYPSVDHVLALADCRWSPIAGGSDASDMLIRQILLRVVPTSWPRDALLVLAGPAAGIHPEYGQWLRDAAAQRGPKPKRLHLPSFPFGRKGTKRSDQAAPEEG